MNTIENGMIKAVIFDCDGTLVDSEQAHFLGWQHALQKRGGNLTSDDYVSLAGKSAETNAEYLARKMGQDCAIEILKDKQEYYHVLQNKRLPPIEATVNFLRRLAKEKTRLGIRLGVASAANKAEIVLNLKHLDIEHLLDIVISGKDDLDEYFDVEGTNKPKPYVYLHTAKLLGIYPSQCIVVEDSYSGICAGVDAGCFTIAIPNKFTEQHDFSRADLKVNSLEGLGFEDFLKNIAGVNRTPYATGRL